MIVRGDVGYKKYVNMKVLAENKRERRCALKENYLGLFSFKYFKLRNVA